MNYHSHSNPKLTASFGDALLASLAPDGGLYMPDKIPSFSPEETAKLGAMSFADCAAALARHFVGREFSNADLKDLCRDAYDFPVPLKTLSGDALDAATPEAANEYIFEMFHGPTLAFKDFAARFMGRAASHLLSKNRGRRTILVATSGDTGGAIGHAFLKQRGIKVFILFPKGGVSAVQQAQLTTMGKSSNVKAIAVDGSFDDCQALVKAAFADDALCKKHKLMSANSINVGRVIPQSFYYFWTSLQVKAAHPGLPVVYSIPSGNLGNLTGGLIARKMGAPIERFVIGNNVNNPFVEYLVSGEYRPRPSVPTLSNAMDIGRPNNFPRIEYLSKGNFNAIQNVCWGASFNDQQTERHIRRVYTRHGYVMCPHTAVGHLAMEEFSKDVERDFIKVTVATAHPAKFKDSVERILHTSIDFPESLSNSMDKTQYMHVIKPELEALKGVLAKPKL